MQQSIKGAQKCKAEYTTEINQIIWVCECALATTPVSRPVFSAFEGPEVNQYSILLDIVYLRNKPFIHCIDNRRNLSETGLLKTRRLSDQIRTFKRIQLYRHGIIRSIRTDQEYSKFEFRKFCAAFETELIAVPANYHEGNRIVERPNRTLRSYFIRLALA